MALKNFALKVVFEESNVQRILRGFTAGSTRWGNIFITDLREPADSDLPLFTGRDAGDAEKAQRRYSIFLCIPSNIHGDRFYLTPVMELSETTPPGNMYGPLVLSPKPGGSNLMPPPFMSFLWMTNP